MSTEASEAYVLVSAKSPSRRAEADDRGVLDAINNSQAVKPAPAKAEAKAGAAAKSHSNGSGNGSAATVRRGPIGRMQAALANAVSDPERKEF